MGNIIESNTSKTHIEKSAKKNIAEILVKLSLAYPSQLKNFNSDEIKIINELWNEIFIGVSPEILHEAVIRFIKEDRKGFFPAPGQIMGYVEEVIAEYEYKEACYLSEQQIKVMNEIKKLRDNGEDYSSCIYCTQANECTHPNKTYGNIYCFDIKNTECLNYRSR